MPALTDIGRFKRLAEAFTLALRLEPVVSLPRQTLAKECLMDHGLSERQAERFMESAQSMLERNMLRSTEQAVKDLATCFRRREHGYILSQMQAIIEADDVTDRHQEFFDICIANLYHGN